MKQVHVAVIVGLLSGAIGPACLAQTGESPRPIARELATLNTTLKEIAQLLRQQVEVQDLDLLMKRLQLSEGQISDTEKRLSSARGELRSVEAEIGDLERRRQLPEELEQAGSGMEPAQAEAIAAQAESELRVVRKRIGEITNEIADLEVRLSEQREEAKGWRSVLDRRLAAH
jgi:chromosome segregation ATPase